MQIPADFSSSFNKSYFNNIEANDIENYVMPSYLQNISQMTVADVYESAADIGKEFERLIDVFGTNEFVNFMPKVVKVLEELEALAERNEQDNLEISNLTYAVEKLETEKTERKWEKLKYEKELEQMEDDWKGESSQLSLLVQRLKNENQKLSRKLEEDSFQSASSTKNDTTNQFENDGPPNGSWVTTPLDNLSKDFEVMNALESTVEKLEKQLKIRDDEIQKKLSESETMENQIMRLSKVCQELRRKNQTLQKHLRILIDDKTDQQLELQDKDHQLVELKEKLTTFDPNIGSLFDNGSNIMTQSLFSNASDMSDDNSPKFTMTELKEVLKEKNELKARLMELEEELALYKPKSKYDDENDENEEPVVQGPINREPEEKLYPWKYSKSRRNQPYGIRRFFRCLIRKISKTNNTNNINWDIIA
ncbi:unnamed protein product [Gordionus sp. m RMFG-2023]